MAYSAWSVVFGEQPSAAKWNTLGSNDAFFFTYTGNGTNAVQQRVYNITGAVATGTTLIPYDDTIPQITEGDQYMTQAITPLSATNVLVIEVLANIAATVTGMEIMALFQDATANALSTTVQYLASGNGHLCLSLKHTMVAGTTSSTTFRTRVGAQNAGTVTFNGAAAARKFGGVMNSMMSITEHKV